MRFPPALAIPFDLVPVPIAERTANMLLQRLVRRHPGLFERLGEHKSKRYAFRPIDLPFVFVVAPADEEVLAWQCNKKHIVIKKHECVMRQNVYCFH